MRCTRRGEFLALAAGGALAVAGCKAPDAPSLAVDGRVGRVAAGTGRVTETTRFVTLDLPGVDLRDGQIVNWGGAKLTVEQGGLLVPLALLSAGEVSVTVPGAGAFRFDPAPALGGPWARQGATVGGAVNPVGTSLSGDAAMPSGGGAMAGEGPITLRPIGTRGPEGATFYQLPTGSAPLAPGTKVQWGTLTLEAVDGGLWLPAALLDAGVTTLVLPDGRTLPVDRSKLLVGTTFLPPDLAGRGAGSLAGTPLAARGQSPTDVTDTLTASLEQVRELTTSVGGTESLASTTGGLPLTLAELLTLPGAVRREVASGVWHVQREGAISLLDSAATPRPDAGLLGALFGPASHDGTSLSGAASGSSAGTASGGVVSSNGGTLVSTNGGSLVSSNGGSLVSTNGGSLVSGNGGGVVSPNGGTLIAGNGAGLVAGNGANLISDAGAGLVVGYPYFPMTPPAARLRLMQLAPQVVPRERVSAGGVHEFLWPAHTRVRALDAAGNPLSGWMQTDGVGAFTFEFKGSVPGIFFIQAELQAPIPGSPLYRAYAMAVAPTDEGPALVVPVNANSTMTSGSTMHLLTYIPPEHARLTSLVSSYSTAVSNLAAENKLSTQESADMSLYSSSLNVATDRQGTLGQAWQALAPLGYGEDLARADSAISQLDAEAMSKATSLAGVYAPCTACAPPTRSRPARSGQSRPTRRRCPPSTRLIWIRGTAMGGAMQRSPHGPEEDVSMFVYLAPTSNRRTRACRALVALSFTASLAGCATPPGVLGDELKSRLTTPAGAARNGTAERARYITLDLPAAKLQGGKLPPGARLVWNGTPLRVDSEGRVAVPERLLAAPGGFTLVIEGVGSARVRPDQLQGDRLQVPEAAIEALTQDAVSAIFRAADASALAAASGGAVPPGGAGGTADSQMPTAEQLRLAPIQLGAKVGLSASGHLGALAALGQESNGVVTFGQGGLTLSQLLLAPGAATYDARTGETTFQSIEGFPGALPVGPSGRTALEQALYGSTSGRGVIVGTNGGTLVSGSGGAVPGGEGGAVSGSQGGALIGPDAGGLVSRSDTGLLGPDSGSLTGQGGSGLIGPDSGSLVRQPGSGLVGLDAGSLTPKTGSQLIGPDGGNLIGLDGGGLIGLDGGGLIADRGVGLVGLDGGSLLAERGAGLVGLDGGSLVNTGAAAMTGYPYFPAAGLAAAKHQLLSVGVPAAPLERVTSGGVREVLLPGKTRVRAISLQGQPLTDWTQTSPSGAFQLQLPPSVPVIFLVLAEARVLGQPAQRASALAFAPGALERPLVVPIDSASTLITASTAFLVDYVPREIARIEALLETLPEDDASYALLDGDGRGDDDRDGRDDDDRDDEDEDEDEDSLPAPTTKRSVAEKRLKTLEAAKTSFNPLYYGVDTRAADLQLDADQAMALSKASSLEEAYAQLRNLFKDKKLAPKSFKPVAPKSPLIISN